jgi:hypothetical protein
MDVSRIYREVRAMHMRADEIVLTGQEMSGLPMSLVTPESSQVRGRVARLVAAGECLCGGADCQHETKTHADGTPRGKDAAHGKRGLSDQCYYAWQRRRVNEVAPARRDPWERQQIRLGRILPPRQGQGKRRSRREREAAAAAVLAAARAKRGGTKTQTRARRAAKSARVR